MLSLNCLYALDLVDATFSAPADGGGKVALELSDAAGGCLVLDGSNTYTGGTTVYGGTLWVETAAALPSGGNLTVGSGAASVFGPACSGAGVSPASCGAGVSPASATPVPEPGTLALLLAGLGIAAIFVGRNTENAPGLSRGWLRSLLQPAARNTENAPGLSRGWLRSLLQGPIWNARCPCVSDERKHPAGKPRALKQGAVPAVATSVNIPRASGLSI